MSALTQKRGRHWTQEEYRAILRHAGPRFRRLIVFCRFSGAKPGEARTLEWRYVAADMINGPRPIFLNSIVAKLLAWLYRHRTHDRFVFTNRDGRPWTRQAIVNHMGEVRARANLPSDVKFYGVRHSFAVGAMKNGVDLFAVSRLLGHRSTQTAQIYGELAKQDDQAAMRQAVRPANKAAAVETSLAKAIGLTPSAASHDRGAQPRQSSISYYRQLIRLHKGEQS
jgi:integrase